MGANVSSAQQINQQITDIISSTINETVQNCSNASVSVQKVNISDITLKGCGLEISGISQKIDGNIDLTCVLTVDNKSKMQNDINAKIDSAVKNAISGLNLGANVQLSNNINQIQNKIKNEIINRNVIDCSVNAANTQLVDISKLKVLDCPSIAPVVKINDLTQLILTNSVAKCTGNIVSDDEINNVIAMSTKSSIENTLQGLSMYDFFISGIVLIIILIISSILLFFSGSGYSSGDM